MREEVLPFPKTIRPFLRSHARFLRHLIPWHTFTRNLTRRALTHAGTTALERTTLIWIRINSHLPRKLGYRLYTLPTSVQFSRTFFAFRLSSDVCSGINSETCCFELAHRQKMTKQKKKNAMSARQLKTFLIIHPLSGQGNSRKKHYRAVNQMSNFYFRYKRKTSFGLSHKGHTKTITMSQKSKF